MDLIYFLKNLAMIPVAYGLSMLFDLCSAQFGGLGVVCFLSILIVSFTVYARRINMSSKAIITFFFILTYTVVYFCIRLTVPILKEPIKALCSVGDTDYSVFTSIFSIAYGSSQILGGYLLGRGGLKTIGIFAMVVGLICFTMSFQTYFPMFLVLRFFLGIFCSIRCTGLAFYLSSYWPKSLFSIIFNFSVFAGYKGAEFLSDYFTRSSAMSWKLIPSSLGLVAIMVGLCILLFCQDMRPVVVEKAQEEEVTDAVEVSAFEAILNNKMIILMFFYSVFSVSIMYIAQDGWLNNIQSHTLPWASKGVLTSIFLTVSGLVSLVFPMLLNIFGSFGFMVASSVAQLVGFFLIQSPMGPNALLISKLAAASFALGGLSHNIPQLLTSLMYSGSRLGIFLGFLNCGAMLLGCSLSQFFFGYIGKIMYPGVSTFSGEQVLSIFRYFAFAPVISAVISVILFLQYRRSCYKKLTTLEV